MDESNQNPQNQQSWGAPQEHKGKFLLKGELPHMGLSNRHKLRADTPGIQNQGMDS